MERYRTTPTFNPGSPTVNNDETPKWGMAGGKIAGPLWANEWNLVFTDERGAPLKRERISQGVFKRLLSEAGLPSMPFHGLRHTAATMLLAAGGNVKAISELLGHSTVSFTLATYTHATFEMHKSEAMRMQDILGGGATAPSVPGVPGVPAVPGTEKA